MNRKKSIALIIDELDTFFYCNLVKGAKMAAEEQGVNLLLLEYGHLFSEEKTMMKRFKERAEVDRQKNTLSALATTDSVDLIIYGPGILCDDLEIGQSLVAQFKDKKKLVLADDIPGVPCIQYDNRSGLEEGLEYLITEKHCKKVVTLAGGGNGADARERLEIFRDVLKRHNLPLTPDMISKGDFTTGCVDAARTLIEKNPDADAVFCANDAMAIAMYRALREKDIRPGKDIYVLGFDNAIEGTRLEPQLATVNADHVNFGYEAVLMAVRILDGEQMGTKRLRTHFVPRESCGFEPYNELLRMETRKKNGVNSYYDIDLMTESIVQYIFTGITHDYQSECQRKLIEDSMKRLAGRYFGNVVKRNTSDDIYNEFSNMIERGGLLYIDPNRLFRVFDTLYSMYCARDMTMTGRSEIEHLLAQMKRKVVELLVVKGENARKIEENVEITIKNFCQSLMNLNGNIEQECEGVLYALEKLSVMNAYLFLYDEPIPYAKRQEWTLPDSLLLKAYRTPKEGILSVQRSRQRVRKDEIVGNLFLTGRIPESYMVLNLFYNSLQYGLIMMDIGEEYYLALDIIGSQLCSTINGVMLRELQRKHELEDETRIEKQLSYIGEEIDVAGFLEEKEFEGMAGSMAQGTPEGILAVTVLNAGSMVELDRDYGSREVKDVIKRCGSILKEVYPKEVLLGYLGNGMFASFNVFTDPDAASESAAEISERTKDLPHAVRSSVSAFRYHEELRASDMLNEAADRVR